MARPRLGSGRALPATKIKGLMAMIKQFSRLTAECASVLTTMTGIHAIPEMLKRPGAGEGRDVGLCSFMQVDGHSCGYAAALSVLFTLKPPSTLTGCLAAARDMWTTTSPNVEKGVPEARLIRALRGHAIVVCVRRSLTFATIRAAIDSGFPVITVLRTAAPNENHWTTVHGYSLRPNRIHLSNTRVVEGLEAVPLWSDFTRRLWADRGFGLICRAG